MNYKPYYDTQTGEILSIIRATDNACIPICKENMDYQQYLRDVPEADRFPEKDLSKIVIPEPPRDLATEITALEERIKILEGKKTR